MVVRPTCSVPVVTVRVSTVSEALLDTLVVSGVIVELTMVFTEVDVKLWPLTFGVNPKRGVATTISKMDVNNRNVWPIIIARIENVCIFRRREQLPIVTIISKIRRKSSYMDTINSDNFRENFSTNSE
jgi:hypothetical protein